MKTLLIASLLLAGCVTGPPIGRLYTDTGKCIELVKDNSGYPWVHMRECEGQAAAK